MQRELPELIELPSGAMSSFTDSPSTIADDAKPSRGGGVAVGVGEAPMQVRFWEVVEGGSERLTPDVWDARVEVDLATLIDRYLIENPPPEGALLPADLRRWADRLRADGQAVLAAQGARALRVA